MFGQLSPISLTATITPPMETRVIDGRKVAEKIKAEVTKDLQELSKKNLVPGLAAVLVGNDPGSQLYVGMKARTSKELGMHSEAIELPAETTTEELLQVIDRLNGADEIDAILIQLPLPDQIDKDQILLAVRPDKDVDGFHPLNVRNLVTGKVGLAPCTPLGIMYLLKSEGIALKGEEAVVVGRSDIVGKPIAFLLLHQHATVTLAHSRTRDLPAVCRRADILVAAVGQPALITRDYLKEGVVIIDVGINRVESVEKGVRLFGENSKRIGRIQERGYTLVGDVHPRDPMGVAQAVTPVPFGVGPLTIAHLMKSTVTACRNRRG